MRVTSYIGITTSNHLLYTWNNSLLARSSSTISPITIRHRTRHLNPTHEPHLSVESKYLLTASNDNVQGNNKSKYDGWPYLQINLTVWRPDNAQLSSRYHLSPPLGLPSVWFTHQILNSSSDRFNEPSRGWCSLPSWPLISLQVCYDSSWKLMSEFHRIRRIGLVFFTSSYEH